MYKRLWSTVCAIKYFAHCHVGRWIYTVTLKIPLKATKLTKIYPILSQDWVEWCCILWAKFLPYFGHFLMISLKTNINSRHRMTNFFGQFFCTHGQHLFPLFRKCLLQSTRLSETPNHNFFWPRKVNFSLLVEDVGVDRRLFRVVRLVLHCLHPVGQSFNPDEKFY